MKERTERTIAMPNEIFEDLREWADTKELKSVHHSEFVYSYYWLIAYLWRYAKYAEESVAQTDIKRMLGYNPNEKRVNYLIKRGGLLDEKNYTCPTADYPVTWELKDGENLSFSMLSEYGKEDQKYLVHFKTKSSVIKSPLKHMGIGDECGIYWNSSNTHIISGDIFKLCMESSELGNAAFYMYGILTYIRDKSKHFNKSSSFSCSNKTLSKLSGWKEGKVSKVTSALMNAELIDKSQTVRIKGSVNRYEIEDSS